MRSFQEVVPAKEAEIWSRWMELQQERGGDSDVLKQKNRREQSRRLVAAFASALQSGNLENIHAPEWRPVLDAVSEVSLARANAGDSTSETATYLFSLKQPIFETFQREFASDPKLLNDAIWVTGKLLDKLGLYSIEIFQKTREDLIRRQQQENLELSTPVVKLFDELIALPLIGTLDSARTQVVMETRARASRLSTSQAFPPSIRKWCSIS
jgi:rsbT co-antagonist protein RsbR